MAIVFHQNIEDEPEITLELCKYSNTVSITILSDDFDDISELRHQLSMGGSEGIDSEAGHKIMEAIEYAEKSGYI